MYIDGEKSLRLMDCKTVKEKINIFDSLSQQEKDEVLVHAQSCEDCRKELIDAARLRETLAELEEVEPPDGLAQSAINKARKSIKIPPFAYISVAVAAVVAVAFFATSSVLGPKTRTVDDTMQMAENDEMFKTNSEVMDEDLGAGVESADMPEEAVMAQSDYEDEALEAANSADGVAEDSDRGPSQCYIHVTADKVDFAQAVETLLTDNDIYIDSYMTDEKTRVIMFVIGELGLEEFKALMEEYEIECDTLITAGSIIEMTIES